MPWQSPQSGYSTIGFAPRDAVPSYPEAWKNCILAVNPSLGHTGDTLYDWSGKKQHGARVNISATNFWKIAESIHCSGLRFAASLGAWDFGDYAGTLLTGAISFWVDIRQFGSERVMFGYSSDISTWNMRIGSSTDGTPTGANAYLVLRVSDGVISNTIRGSTVLVQSRWYHIVLIAANGQYYMWIDGRPETLTVLAGSNNGKFFGDILKAGTIKLSWASSIWFSTAWSSGQQGHYTDMRLFDSPISDGLVQLLSQRPGIAYEFDSIVYKTIISNPWYDYQQQSLTVGSALDGPSRVIGF